ncbi:S53 family peptidase [Streptomyces sp. NPDC093801]|uniref:S53 family peptidase n=1 Tax=Streptomyces sp. NPDC093801 TaxID=3155203 RepID=UPI00345074C4
MPIARPAWAMSGSDRGEAAEEGIVEARIWLAGRDPKAATRYAQAVSTPRDPLYRHFLTPAEFQERFGPSAVQSQQVAAWAGKNGLKTTETTAHYISVSGPVGAMEKALAVPFHTYDDHGRSGTAPARTPTIPHELASAVLTVTGLDRLDTAHPAVAELPAPGPQPSAPGPCSPVGKEEPSGFTGADGRVVSWAPCGYTPEQLREAYGVRDPGMTGKGVTIAVVNAYTSPTMAADLERYAHDHGEPLRPGQYREVNSQVWDQLDSCSANTWYGEQTKDVQAVHGMAPEADIVYVGARNCTPSAFNEALLKVVDLRLADVVSCSWGETTDGYGVQERLISHSVFEQGAIEGIGFYVASGDAGYEDPSTGPGRASGSRRLQVDYPASDPLVTAVGGTSLSVGADGAYAHETSWGQYRVAARADARTWRAVPPGDYPRDWVAGTGGGTSIMYEQPWYQAPVVPEALSKALPGGVTGKRAMRVVPDIALVADPLTGMLVGETTATADGKDLHYGERRSGGTSLSCPLFAGMQALVQQAGGGRALGFANPALYLLHGSGAITDVTDTPLGADHPVAWTVNRYEDQANETGPWSTYLATTGRNGEGAARLGASKGFDNTTGLGSPSAAYIGAYLRPPS